MELKDYQRRVLERFDELIKTLEAEYTDAVEYYEFQKDKGKDAVLHDFAKAAWDKLKSEHKLPRVRSQHGLVMPDHVDRRDQLGRSIPHVCLKVPTGGGKTLLAAEAVGNLHRDFFRRQNGLMLWVVPTVQIYRQTWKALANREHPYRQSLERATGGRVKILEKDDPFTQHDTDHYLCIMLVRLAATNRANNKEFLKIFRDAGKYTKFFPEVDDYASNNQLLQQYPDLEVNDIADSGAFPSISVKHSLVNVFKMNRPVVLIDEGHKAYSDNTRASLNSFNPSFILELTATPNVRHHVSNVLVDVSGLDLKEEQMIKLPINIANTKNGDWQATLSQAHNKLDELTGDAQKLQTDDGRYVRPIMVIRVERTGKNQRDGQKIHALDARDYLIEKLAIKEEEIRIKSSEKDELGDTDLFDPLCPVRFIITKEALQEGWDCSFAYILALLDNTTAPTAMTQMVGRVLRQPHAQTTSIDSLNECFVYCYNQDVNIAVENVRRGLEEEGMTGLSDFVKSIDDDGDNADTTAISKNVKRAQKFSGLKIFLPKVLHKEGDSWRDIHYEGDILALIPWHDLEYDAKEFLDNKDAALSTITAVDVQKKKSGKGEQGEFDLVAKTTKQEGSIEKRLDVGLLSRPLLDVVPNPWQATRILLNTIEALKVSGKSEEDIYDGRLFLVENMKRHLKTLVHEIAEVIFRNKMKNGDITFRLLTNGNEKLNFEIAQDLRILARKNEPKLVKSDNTLVKNSLFEVVFEKDLNSLEKDFAVYLSESDSVTWWHRMVARQDYALQGWQRNKVYPDFIACVSENRLLVLETKGLQLKGNDDTEYKQKLFELVTNYQSTGLNAGTLGLKTDDETVISFHMLMEDTWKDEFHTAQQDQ